MSTGLERMIQRAEYTGYNAADGRNVKGKYKSFQAALKNSYQAEWIILDPDTEKVGDKLTPVKNAESNTLVLEATESTDGMIWVVVKVYTMPDGQPGLKIQRVQ